MRLFRTTDTLLVCVMIAAAAFTYKAKHDAEGQLAELRRIEADIRLERETIDIIEADLSLLTQPARLQRLAEAFAGELDLKPLEPTQIGTLDELPARRFDLEILIREDSERAALSRPDPTITAAVPLPTVRP